MSVNPDYLNTGMDRISKSLQRLTSDFQERQCASEAAGATKRPGEVEKALSRIELEINRLTTELDALEETLRPIMAARPSVDQPEEAKEASSVSVPIALRISAAAGAIQGLVYFVTVVRERVSI